MPKQHTWNRDTLNDGELLEDEFVNIYQEIENLQDVESALTQEITDRQNADNLKANKAGDMFTGAITIPNGTLSGHAVNKSQLDAEAAARANADNAQQTQIDDKLSRTNDLVDSTDSTVVNKAATPNAVKLLKDLINTNLSSNYYTKAQIDATVNNLLNNMDATTLNSLAELAAAINNDPDFGTAVYDAIADRVRYEDVIDVLTSYITDKPLSANQGRVLNEGKANVSHTHVKADITDLTEFVEVNSIPIGMPFPQWFEGNSEAVVSKYQGRFIKLSKGLTGVGLYNNGKLGSQTSETTNETTFYSATITDVTSPLNGQSVTLINSVENTTGTASAQPAFLGAGEVANQKLANMLQGHKYELFVNLDDGSQPSNNSSVLTYNNEGPYINALFTNNVVTDGTNGTPRLGKTTRPDTVTAIYYMRIK